MTAPPVAVVMGVSGSGKTTIGKRLAARLGVDFAEGDEFHPKSNVEKMRRGEPLNDEDRWPWLRAVAKRIDQARADPRAEHLSRAGGSTAAQVGAERRGLVVACSALKRAYRDILIGDRTDVHLVYLRGSRAVIGERVGQRKHEYMPASLLPSQFAALEEPGPDEHAIVADVAQPVDQNIDAIAEAITQRATRR